MYLHLLVVRLTTESIRKRWRNLVPLSACVIFQII